MLQICVKDCNFLFLKVLLKKFCSEASWEMKLSCSSPAWSSVLHPGFPPAICGDFLQSGEMQAGMHTVCWLWVITQLQDVFCVENMLFPIKSVKYKAERVWDKQQTWDLPYVLTPNNLNVNDQNNIRKPREKALYVGVCTNEQLAPVLSSNIVTNTSNAPKNKSSQIVKLEKSGCGLKFLDYCVYTLCYKRQRQVY